MSDDAQQLVKIDDRDPRLVYTGTWSEAGTSADYDNTTSISQTAGSTVTFTFNGTFIAVYGTIGPTASSSTYQLDDDSVSTASFPPPASPLYDEPFWSSAELSPGIHTLTVAAMGDGDTYQLDYMQYTGYPGPVIRANAPQQPTQSHPPILSSSESSSRSGLSTAAVAGIAVGCGILMIISTVTAYWLYRRRRRRRVYNTVGALVDIETEPDEPAPSAFDILSKFSAPVKHYPPASHGTTTTAVFSSVVFLTPPVSVASGPRSNAARSVT